MNIAPFPFQITNWAQIEKTEHYGETGIAYWRTQYFGEEGNKIRVRLVEYSANYLADHWCEKGHILFCLEGELESRLKDGRKFILTSDMSYQVGDHSEPHQSFTSKGAKLLIVD